jgi:pSer/pThr/pTyr-binding forkhead associated (FHA) protein
MVIAKYTAPEQAEDPTATDILSDMFSLGAIFYALVVGEPPFNFKNPRQYIKFLMAGKQLEAQEIQNTAKYLLHSSCELIASLLSWDKSKRPTPQKLLSLLGSEEEDMKTALEKLDALEQMAITSSGKTNIAAAQKTTPLGDDEPPFSPSFMAILDKVDKAVLLPQEKKGEGEYCIETLAGASDGQKIEYNFVGNRKVIIGREGDIKLSHDPKVSRTHAQLEVKEGIAFLTDLQSQNGTYVNGHRITHQEIAPGAEFRVGNILLRFRKIHTVLGGILEDAQEELSDENIAPLQELRITSLYPQQSLAALPPAEESAKNTSERLQEIGLRKHPPLGVVMKQAAQQTREKLVTLVKFVSFT